MDRTCGVTDTKDMCDGCHFSTTLTRSFGFSTIVTDAHYTRSKTMARDFINMRSIVWMENLLSTGPRKAYDMTPVDNF